MKCVEILIRVYEDSGKRKKTLEKLRITTPFVNSNAKNLLNTGLEIFKETIDKGLKDHG